MHWAFKNMSLTKIYLSTFREIRTKEDIEFVENGTEISYRESKAYVFVRNMSAGSENDSFTLVNLPILVSHSHSKS